MSLYADVCGLWSGGVCCVWCVLMCVVCADVWSVSLYADVCGVCGVC